MEFLSSIFDFEKQLAFYSAYHHNWVNKIIHVIFVPTIMSTVLVWLSNYWVVDGSISLAHIVAAIYGLYYIVLEKTAGVRNLVLILYLITYLAFVCTGSGSHDIRCLATSQNLSEHRQYLCTVCTHIFVDITVYWTWSF